MDLRSMLIKEGNIKEALDKINQNSKRILFVVDKSDRLVGTITDGDIRRALLEGKNLQTNINEIVFKNPKFVYKDKIYEAKKIFQDQKFDVIPILNSNNQVIDYLDRKSYKIKKLISNKVLIMAGGKGTRLLPLTRVIPKPLVPFKNETIIENIMGQFLKYGFDEFVLSVNYKKDMIKNYFKPFKYKIDYIEETEFLGTAGSIAFMKDYVDNKPFIVSNCDILLDVDYSEALEKHIQDKIDITIFAATEEIDISYGIIKSDANNNFLGIEEKPSKKYLVNTGIYILNPQITELIEKNEKIDMPELINRAKERGMSIKVFESKNSMIDIGQWKNYKKFIEY